MTKLEALLPCTHPPGSPERLAHLAARARYGLPIKNAADFDIPVPLPNRQHAGVGKRIRPRHAVRVGRIE
jgi:hypothetical protein